MKRFSEENLVILQGKDVGYFYDVPTSSIFQSGLETIEKAVDIQSGDPDTPEYKEFEAYLSKYTEGKPTPLPTHQDFLQTKRLSKLTLLVATTCNLRCKYCYAGFGSYSGYEKEILTPQKAVAYIEALNEYCDEIEVIQFFGGEPLLGIEAIEAVCEAIEKMVSQGKIKSIPHYTMITNLTLVSEKALRIIQEYDISITVSIDGPSAINDQLRIDVNGAGTFDQVSKNIIKCKSQINAIEATYTKLHEKCGWTMESLRDYLSTTFQMQEDLIYVCPAIGDGPLCFKPDEAKTAKLRMKGLDSENISCLYALKSENQSDLLCNAGYTSLALMPNGDLYPCHFFVLDRSYCMGHHQEESLSYNGLSVQSDIVRQKLIDINKFDHSECQCCWARNICHRCPAESLIFQAQKKIDFSCELRRASTKQHLIEALECASLNEDKMSGISE